MSLHWLAGLGRAPSTALAYMFWLRGWDLEEGREAITGKRACTPRVESIRAATADLLSGTGPIPVTVGLRRWGTAQKVQVRSGRGRVARLTALGGDRRVLGWSSQEGTCQGREVGAEGRQCMGHSLDIGTPEPSASPLA